MRVSKGFLRDLACLHLASALMFVSKKEYATVRHGDNKNHHQNKRIDRKIKKLYDATLECSKGDFLKRDELFVQKLREEALYKLAKFSDIESMSYELTGMYLLYYRFIDGRDKKLDPRFDFIKSDKIFDIGIAVSELTDRDGQLEMNLAKKVLESIR